MATREKVIAKTKIHMISKDELAIDRLVDYLNDYGCATITESADEEYEITFTEIGYGTYDPSNDYYEPDDFEIDDMLYENDIKDIITDYIKNNTEVEIDYISGTEYDY